MEKNKCWGYSTHIDLYQCDEIMIRRRDDIISYVDDLCKLIEMKKYGECLLEHFGQDENVKGYTFVQMIETSLISGHMVELTNDAHIDIFSCSNYDPHKVANFTKNYFKSKSSKYKSLIR